MLARPPIAATPLILLLTLLDPARGATPQPDVNKYSELVRSKVGVLVDPLDVSHLARNESVPGVGCELSIHRENCLNPRIRAEEKISWNTRICFKWTCTNTTEHAMRVQECWTGSATNPIYLIDERGCSKEKTMVSNPRYERDLLTAYSVGWLTVRLVGADKVRLHCAVRLCHVCEPDCAQQTPPRPCLEAESPLLRYHFSRWNDTEQLQRLCRPEQATAEATALLAPRLPAALLLLLLLCGR